jgi:hypothetical protein
MKTGWTSTLACNYRATLDPILATAGSPVDNVSSSWNCQILRYAAQRTTKSRCFPESMIATSSTTKIRSANRIVDGRWDTT